jgi:hypothetical protein
MHVRTTLAAAGAAAALAIGFGVAGSASAATLLGGCSVTDVIPNAVDCAGFYQGNLLSNSPTDVADQTTALASLGLTWDGTLQEAQLELNSSTIDFSTLLNGTTYIGIHWGAGQGPVNTQGGVTGFYRLDLASDAQLDTILAAFGSQSGARLYFTTACSGDCNGGGGGSGEPVPEPATWAMMIFGFGGVGAMLRRRRETLLLTA